MAAHVDDLKLGDPTGQRRDPAPRDLPLHDAAARHRRLVPFENEQISILGPVELAVLEAMFDRTRDWADIEAMLAAGTLDVDAVRDHLISLAGEDDDRLARVDEAVRQADAESR